MVAQQAVSGVYLFRDDSRDCLILRITDGEQYREHCISNHDLIGGRGFELMQKAPFFDAPLIGKGPAREVSFDPSKLVEWEAQYMPPDDIGPVAAPVAAKKVKKPSKKAYGEW